MNAKERLRLYLEQRREMGETQFVLDSLSVDEVMKLVGATGSTRRSTPDTPPEHQQPEHQQPEHQPLNSRVAEHSPAAVTDWREHLTAPTGASSTPLAPNSGRNTPANTFAASASASATPSPHSAPSNTFPVWITELGVATGNVVGNQPLTTANTSNVPEITALDSLDSIANSVASCTRCSLYATALNPVPGEGNTESGFVCVGEAPGQAEDEQGRPFTGPAGQLLTKILTAIDFKREDVFICNVLKHRPPRNRNPLPEEVAACAPYLAQQLAIIQPRVILALGSFAATTLLNSDLSLGKLRGKVHLYHGIPLVATYHPAALLRNENWKRPTWEDVKLARKIYDATFRHNTAP